MALAADPLAGLRDIRVPAPTIETLLADLLIAIAVGILLALLLSVFARVFLRKRRSLRDAILAALEGARDLPLKDRLLAQAAILKQAASDLPLVTDSGKPHNATQSWTARLDRWFGSDFFSNGTGARLREALYHREPAIDPDAVERELVRLIRRARDRA
jgi:uncharacterized membrane protein